MKAKIYSSLLFLGLLLNDYNDDVTLTSLLLLFVLLHTEKKGSFLAERADARARVYLITVLVV